MTYKDRVAIIDAEIRKYNKDHQRQHLQDVREYAALNGMQLELVPASKGEKIVSFAIGNVQYTVKGDVCAYCKLGKTAKLCGVTPAGCYSCGWWTAVEDLRKRRIHSGGLVGYPAHLVITRKIKKKE